MRVAVSWLSLGALVLVGCRTVWVHPEATADKYADDTFFCKYGIERSEWVPPEPEPGERVTQSDRAWALESPEDYAELGEPRSNWKRCMVRLGWGTGSGSRDGYEWRVSSKPMPRRR